MKYIDGDLIQLAKEGKFDVIGHGCNCFCNMGAGIAKSIKESFPEAYKADRQTPYADVTKLGKMSFGKQGDLVILNLYTQFDTGKGLKAHYDAIRECMKAVKKRYSGKRIGLPLIGAGLAGGDWNIISKIIEDELGDEDVTIVKFKK